MRSLVLAFIGCMACVSAWSQTTGDYRSAGPTGNWNTNTSWERFNGTTWVGASFAPVISDGVITVQSGHTITMTSGELIDQVVVAGTLRVNASVSITFSNINADVLTVNSGGILELFGAGSTIATAANAKLRVNGTVIGRQGSSISGATAANVFFEANSVYQHVFTSSAGTIPLATWNATSTLLFTGSVTTGTAPTNLNQNFGNVTYNVPGSTPTLALNGQLTNIKGTFSTASTNVRPITLATVSAYNFNVDGNFVLDGSGTVIGNVAGAGVNSSITIKGNYSQSGGVFTIVNGGGNMTINVAGDFTRTAGTITKAASGTGLFNFNGTLPRVYTSTATTFGNINFAIAGGSTLDFGTSPVVGTGTFTLNTGATVIVGSTDSGGAISSTGNIRVTGTKTFASGSTVIYHNNSNTGQFLGSGHPGGAGITTIIDNTGGVTLQPATYVLNGDLVLTNGDFNISGRDMTFGGNFTPNSNFLVGDASTILTISDGGTTAPFGSLRVSGTSVIGTLNISGATGRTVSLGADLAVSTDVNLNNGDLQLNGFTLDISGSITQSGGTLTASATSGLTISDSGIGFLPPDVVISGGSLGTMTMNRLGADFITSSNLQITTLNLVTGSFTHTGTVTMAANGKINVGNGILTNPVAAVSVYDVEYNGAEETDTGVELPTSGTTLRHLIVTNPSQVNLKAPGTVVNGDLILSAGTFFADTTDITLRGNFQSDAISDFIAGSALFDGTSVISGSVAPQFGTVVIISTRSLALDANMQINVAGNFADDGTFTANQGTVSLNGTADQHITGASTTTFYGLEVNKESMDVIIQHPVRILDVVRVLTATQVTTVDNMVTLMSNAVRTARINPLLPGAAINGSVIVQRYLPSGVPGKKYRYLASPVTNSNVGDWQNEFPVTGPFTDPTGGNASASMYYYDETFLGGGGGLNDRYRNYPASGTAASAPLVHGRGYAVYPFADNAMLFDTRGTLGQQQVVANVTAQSGGGDDGWNLIGNPYPSPVLWNKITRSVGVDDAVYITDNTLINGGGFQTYVNGVGVPGNFGGTIDMGQGFWVHATANGTVTFDETDKIISTDSVIQIFRQAPRPDVLRIAMTGTSVKDELAISFHPDASDNFDKAFDALKLKNSGLNLSSLSADNREMTINTMASMDCTKEVALAISGVPAGSYKFTASGFETFGSDFNFILVDKKTSISTDLRSSNAYDFTITAEDMSTLNSRFVVQTERTRVLTDLAVNGTSICYSDTDPEVTVLSSQPEVEYQVLLGASAISPSLKGNGGALSLPVTAKGLLVGDNTFSIVAKNGCVTNKLAAPAIVNRMSQTSTPGVADVLVCSSGSALLTATGAANGQSYNWYSSKDSGVPVGTTANGSFEVSGLTSSTSYYAAVTNSLGCESDRARLNIDVVNYDPVAIEVNGPILTSNYVSGNQWYLDGTLLPGEDNPVLEATESGTYTVKVNVEGCTIESSVVQEITGVEESPAGVKIYPNPVVSVMNINLPAKVAGTSNVSIVNSSGKVVYSGRFEPQRTITIDASDLAAGMYIVRIEIDGRIVSQKIIKI